MIACSSGEEALEQFKRGGIDLVLTDLVMPGVDGGKLIEAIKTISPQTPAILLSGKVRIYERETQADVFLPKGMYAPAELLERIRLLLVRKRGPSGHSHSPRPPAAPAPLTHRAFKDSLPDQPRSPTHTSSDNKCPRVMVSRGKPCVLAPVRRAVTLGNFPLLSGG